MSDDSFLQHVSSLSYVTCRFRWGAGFQLPHPWLHQHSHVRTLRAVRTSSCVFWKPPCRCWHTGSLVGDSRCSQVSGKLMRCLLCCTCPRRRRHTAGSFLLWTVTLAAGARSSPGREPSGILSGPSSSQAAYSEEAAHISGEGQKVLGSENPEFLKPVPAPWQPSAWDGVGLAHLPEPVWISGGCCAGSAWPGAHGGSRASCVRLSLPGPGGAGTCRQALASV